MEIIKTEMFNWEIDCSIKEKDNYLEVHLWEE